MRSWWCCCLLKAPDRRGDGAGLESPEAGGCAVPGGAAGLHRPHQLLPGLHPGSHAGASGRPRHATPAQVSQALPGCFSPLLPSVTDLFFFSPQGSDSLNLSHPQPSLHTPLFCVFLPRTAGNASQFPGRLAAVPVSHLTGDPGPFPIRLFGVPTDRPAGLSLLAAFLEYPLLEIEAAI